MNFKVLCFAVAAVCAADCVAYTKMTPNDTLSEVVVNSQLAVDLARRGDYGRLSTRDIKLANASLKRIEELTAGKASIDELSIDDREALTAARERLDTVLRLRNKNRIVCVKRTPLGTRIGKQECMTIGQREERARKAQREAHGMQHQIFCLPPNAEGVGVKCAGGG